MIKPYVHNPKPDRNKGVFYMRKIPNDIKHEFKTLCTQLGITQQDQMIIILREWVAREKKRLAEGIKL